LTTSRIDYHCHKDLIRQALFQTFRG